MAMIVGVLANDNPQGLLLACRLLGHCRVRVSVGGRLGRLLEEGWSLRTEDIHGKVTRVHTRVLRRGTDDSTKSEEDLSQLNTLWLCDWKDPASGWYSLSDCHLLLQTSKATDSKTVAMWLVEVCRDDAVIVSLQQGLHNARELRTVFGHRSPALVPAINASASEQDMPLVHHGRRTTGSVDTTDGVMSRRESASSIYSEFSGGMEGDDVDSCERSSSPLPPGIPSSPPASDSSDRRKSFSRRSGDDDGAAAGEEQPKQQRSKLGSTPPTKVSDDDEQKREEEKLKESRKADDEQQQGGESLKKPATVLLAGVLGYGACCEVDESSKTVLCSATHHGAIVMERLTKKNALQALGRIMLLERSGFPVRYRACEETNNWLWGDVVWRTFEAYGAALRLDRPMEPRSLYALLADRNDPTHRRVYAGLLDEALSALRWQKVELMDPASSPFGLSFRTTRSLLLLPTPVFELALWLVLTLRFPLEAKVRKTAPFCDSTMVHRYMAPFLNGEVVRIGFEGEVSTPLNQEILESLSVVARRQPQQSVTSSSTPMVMVKTTPLPELYSMPFFLAVCGCVLLLLTVFVRFVWFVIDVTFFW